MNAPATDSRTPEAAPPYFPFRQLTNLLVRMETEGIPRRLDRGYLDKMAGGTIAPFLTGLRALGLIDTEERPQKALVTLVEAGEDRPELVAELLRDKYPWANELGLAKATHQELEEAFRAHGPSGSTVRKSISFYLAAARYAGIPLSPFFKETRAAGESGGSRRAAARGKKIRRADDGDKPETPPALIPPDETASMRREYFDLLKSKAGSSDPGDTDLLDRIERLIGVMEAASKTTRGEV